MSKFNQLYFETDIQVKLFFVILNKPKGITRDELSKQIEYPRTTIYDNLIKMEKRKFHIAPNKEIPYIKHYIKKMKLGKGRNNTLYYIPKVLRNYYIEVNML